MLQHLITSPHALTHIDVNTACDSIGECYTAKLCMHVHCMSRNVCIVSGCTANAHNT